MKRAQALILAVALALLLVPALTQAQGTGEGFFFKEPVATWALRAGFDHANAQSDIFSFTSRELTVDRGDFSGFTIASDVNLRVSPRLGVVLGASYSGSSTPSESRNFVGTDDLPIEQTTSFKRVPITASLKAYLTPRGRSVGSFAWIPAKVAPYLGAGGGAMWYSFHQNGEFVDPETLAVFDDTFNSSGWTPEAHAMAGVDISLAPRLVLTGEGRYTYAKADMDEDFVNFDRIDLSGFAVTAGLAIRF
jgi:hypothetical protein